MSWRLLYHPDVKKEDLPQIPQNMRTRIQKAIEDRLVKDPEKYGEPLRRGLQGFRKLRVGDYRIIYRVSRNKIIILKIGHRKEVYEKTVQRL